MAARWRRVAAWGVAAVVVAGVAVVAVRHFRAKPTNATPQYYVVPVTVGPVSSSVSGTGDLVPVTTDTVAPPVSGTVSAVKVSIGQTVKKGQTMFTLADTSGLANQVTSAKASLLNAENQLLSLTAPTVDPRTVEQKQLSVTQAKVALQQAQQNLAQTESTLKTDAEVATPLGGTIVSVDVQNNQTVNPGTVVAVLQPSAAPEISVAVPQYELSSLPLGTRAAITLPSSSGTVYIGSVAHIAAAAAGASNGSGNGTGSGSPTGTSAGTGTGGGTVSNVCAASGTPTMFDLTIAVPKAPETWPGGASANVVLTPTGDPPACEDWSAMGTITYPSTIALSAQTTGTVSHVPSVGQVFAAGASVASVDSTTSATTLQQAQSTVQQDQWNLQNAQISLSQTVQPQPPSADSVKAQRLQIESLQTQLAQAEQNLAELTVTSPMTGLVTAVNLAVGQTVGPSTQAVSLESAGQFLATASIDELNIADVHAGETAQIALAAYPNKTFTGRVASISPVAQNQNGVSTFGVDVAVDPASGLLAGMSDTVTIQVQNASDAIRVPAQAVTIVSGNSGIVKVMPASGTPVATPVTVGIVGATYTQILKGLQPGQGVVAGVASSGTAAFAFAGRARPGGRGGGGPSGGAVFRFGGGPGG